MKRLLDSGIADRQRRTQRLELRHGKRHLRCVFANHCKWYRRQYSAHFFNGLEHDVTEVHDYKTKNGASTSICTTSDSLDAWHRGDLIA